MGKPAKLFADDVFACYGPSLRFEDCLCLYTRSTKATQRVAHRASIGKLDRSGICPSITHSNWAMKSELILSRRDQNVAAKV
jgi:hypothetical protein